MIKDIKFNGVTTVPSDYVCPDGDLAQAPNLVIDADGDLTQAGQPANIKVGNDNITVANNEALVFIHKNTNLKNYILTRYDSTAETYSLYYINGLGNSATKTTVSASFSAATIHQVTSVGNTLLALTDEGMYYFLWKDDAYIHLGNHLPEVGMEFTLIGKKLEVGDTEEGQPRIQVTVEGGAIQKDASLNQQQINSLTTGVMAEVVKFTNAISEGTFYAPRTGGDLQLTHGAFLYPFLVRYALRLYDGTNAMHSTPVLMVTANKPMPVVSWQDYNGDAASNPSLHINAIACELAYKSEAIPSVWRDIVVGMDVYVSAPIYNINQSGKVNSVKTWTRKEFFGYMNLDGASETGFFRREDYFPKGQEPVFTLPEKSEEEVLKEIKECGTFYKLKEFNATDLNTTANFVKIEIPQYYLTSLVNKEVMTDDFFSHDTLKPTIAFNYNNRINYSGLSREVFAGFDPKYMYQHTDHSYVLGGTTYTPVAKRITSLFYQIYIKNGGKDAIISYPLGLTTQNLGFDGRWLPVYFFYPNQDAYKVIISIGYNDDTTVTKVFLLEQHAKLNGAVWTASQFYQAWTDDSGVHPATTDSNHNTTVSLPNVVYTSEVNNPFNFTSSGANTIGTGKVLGLSTATKALSEGQFGQFPLYCFTDEGVWALEVMSTGYYRATHPVSRDVCNNKDSITQIDTAVLFTTERGIMLLSGSSTTCISTPLEDKAFVTSHLPGLSTLTGYPTVTAVDFHTYLHGARMAYDYTHQRIYVFNSAQPYCYIYNIKTKKWTMQMATFISAVNSYPDAYVVSDDGTTKTLVNLSKDSSVTGSGMVITRPIKLDTTALKTVNAIILRGVFQTGHVKTILYGSRDILTWHLLGSSTNHRLRRIQGTPYKFFRLALPVSLTEGESLYGFTVDFEPKYRNKIR